MGTPKNYEDYISIKITPVPRNCCCFHCWPETWHVVNRHICPCGPLEDEGDALIHADGEKYVLQCHESGPEIIIYFGLATASILLLKSVVELIVTLLKALQGEERRKPDRIKIAKRLQIRGKVEVEELIEVDLPVSDDVQKKIDDVLKEHLKK